MKSNIAFLNTFFPSSYCLYDIDFFVSKVSFSLIFFNSFSRFPNLCLTGIFIAKLTKSLSMNGNLSSNPLAIANLSPTKNNPGRKVLISKYNELFMCSSGLSYFSLSLKVKTLLKISLGLLISILL